jgi:DNA-binding transcriptional regulator YhcF (GntR family)
MTEGYIQLHRKIQDHWIWDKKRKYSEFEAWLDLLINARWQGKSKKHKIGLKLYVIKRGDQIRSMKTLAETWNWNTSKVRRFLKLLENDNMIRITTDTQTTHVSIINYNTYQVTRIANESQMKRKRISDEFQMNTTKESIKNIKEDEEGESPPPPLSIFDSIKSDIGYITESDMIKDLHQQDPNIVKKIIHDTMASLGYGKAESLWYYEDKLIPAKFSVYKKGQANVIKLITDIVDLHNRKQIFIKRS